MYLLVNKEGINFDQKPPGEPEEKKPTAEKPDIVLARRTSFHGELPLRARRFTIVVPKHEAILQQKDREIPSGTLTSPTHSNEVPSAEMQPNTAGKFEKSGVQRERKGSVYNSRDRMPPTLMKLSGFVGQKTVEVTSPTQKSPTHRQGMSPRVKRKGNREAGFTFQKEEIPSPNETFEEKLERLYPRMKILKEMKQGDAFGEIALISNATRFDDYYC